MKITVSQLGAHLKQGFAPVYLLHGDEPYQKMAALQMLREHAVSIGITDRERVDVSTGFDWENWYTHTQERSLFSTFSEKRLLECHLAETLSINKTIGSSGTKMLNQFFNDPSPDIVLIITAPKLDNTALSSTWFKAIEAKGVTLCIRQNPNVSPSVFHLIDALTLGSIHKVKKIFFCLKQEVDSVLVLWAISKTIRALPFTSTLNRPMMLSKAKHIDDIIKGYIQGNAWDELYLLCLYFIGVTSLDV